MDKIASVLLDVSASCNMNVPMNDTARRVEEEGIGARNLLNWIADGLDDATKAAKKPSTSRHHSASPNSSLQDKANESKFPFKMGKRRSSISRPKNRLRSASAGRNPEKDLRARYWTFLFENLHRAVDEIYQTCEMDESIVESKEAIMMLENYSKDFHALIQWLNISKSYEKADPIDRPTSLTWEVRKSSPGKSLLKNVFIDKLTAGNSHAKRVLCFDSACEQTFTSVQSESKDAAESKLKGAVQDNNDTVSEKQNFSKSAISLNNEKLNEKSEIMKKDNNEEVSFIENQCDVKISVHKSTEDLFPCNKDLVIKEIKVVNGVAAPNLQTEDSTNMNENFAEDIATGSVVIVEGTGKSLEKVVENPELVEEKDTFQINEQVINISENPSNEQPVKNSEIATSETALENEKNVEHDVTKVSGDVTVQKNEQTVDNAETTALGNATIERSGQAVKNVSNNEVIIPRKAITAKTSEQVQQIRKKTVPRSKETVKNSTPPLGKRDVAVGNEETLSNSVSTERKNYAGAPKDLVRKTENKSTCTIFNDDVTNFPNIKDTIGIKTVPKKVQISTARLVKKSASTELLPLSSKANIAPSEAPQKVSQSKKDDPSKLATGKTDPNHSSKNLALSNAEPPRSTRPTSANKSHTSATLTRSKTCVIGGVTSNRQTSENSISLPAWVSFTKPLSTAVKKVVVPRTPAVTSEKKTSRVNGAEVVAKKTTPLSRTITLQDKKVNTVTRPVAGTSVQKAVPPARTVSHAIKLPQKSGSLTSLQVTSRKNWSEKTTSAEQIASTETSKDPDGWETVRGRTRSRNSPAKKIPPSDDTKCNQVAHIAKLNQSRIGGFPYTTKASQTSSNVSKTLVPKKNDPSNVKVDEKKCDAKTAAQSKTNSSTTELAKKKVPASSTALNRTLLNIKKTATAKSSGMLGSGDAIPVVNTTETKVDTVNASKDYKLSEKLVPLNNVKEDSTITKELNQNLNESENLRQLHRKESLTLPLKSCSNENTEYSCILTSKNLMKSSSAPSLCNIYEEIDFNCKKAFSDNEQSFDKCIEQNIKLQKKKNSVKINNSSKFSDESNVSSSLDESDICLTSEDTDDTLSQDEAYDVQTQELYDTARKYKILEEQVHKLELSWGEQMDTLDMELRTPGRALEMHEKLSSPFRKRSILESIRLCNEKQVKAQEQRERFLEEKAQKFKDIQKKRHEMKALVEKRQEQQRIIMEQKLERAEKQRKKQLEIIVRKAHDEEEKVNEIAFINTLEAQNKRHDLISKEKDHEARLQDIQDERQRRQEEKAAKEAAAEERRKILEADRQARLIEMQEKRKLKDLKIEQQFLEKEKERQELANQKARDRELRISALNAAQQTTIEELQKKIQLKQEESARRHEENMEQIRQKAFELSIQRCSSNNDDAPQPVPYETKKICTICNVLIGSEVYLLSHLRGKKHQETVKDQHQGQDPSTEELELYNLKHIVDASTDQLDPNIAFDKERQKALKKRCKKLRQRMSNRGLEYETQLQKIVKLPTSNSRNKMEKTINDIKKLISTHGTGMNDTSFLNSLDRLLTDLNQFPSKGSLEDKALFCKCGGVGMLVNILSKVSSLSNENNAFILKKIVAHASKTVECFVENCYENCHYALFSNKIGNLLDLLIYRLNTLIPDNFSQLMANSSKLSGITLQVDLVSGKLMHFLSILLITLSESEETESNVISDVYLNQLKDKERQKEEFQQRVQDSISYIVSIGIVDKLAQYFNSIQGPISNEAEVAPFLLDSITFLMSLINLFSKSLNSTAEQKKTEDTTQLIATFKLTNLVGAVSLLYGLLLHSGASSRGDTKPQQLPQHTVQVVLSMLSMLNHVALMNLQAFQSILGSEGLSLQLRHITSHLLWYCNHCTSESLLHEVILLIGYFTVLNPENQLIIQAGQWPTVLQQLCSLPFLYFSDSELIDILFPTLISCSFNSFSNKSILEQEMSSELLSNYIEAQSLNIHQTSQLINRKNSVKKRWLFSTRFPKDRWSSARQYFSVEK